MTPNGQKTRAGRAGFTLVEVLVAIVLVGILLRIAEAPLSGRIRNMRVKECAVRLAADIRLARASAMSEGRRVQLVVSDTGAAKDFGNGSKALWMTFVDSYPATGSYLSGDKVLACSSCASSTKIESIAALASLPAGPTGASGVSNLSTWFFANGTVKDTAINSGVVFTSVSDNKYKVRVLFTSLTGYVRVQSCTVAGAVTCANGSDWSDI